MESKLSFRTWMEVGGSVWDAPPRQDPTKVVQGPGPGNQAFADFHGKERGIDPTNPEGQLPPVKKKRLRMKKT